MRFNINKWQQGRFLLVRSAEGEQCREGRGARRMAPAQLRGLPWCLEPPASLSRPSSALLVPLLPCPPAPGVLSTTCFSSVLPSHTSSQSRKQNINESSDL